MPVANRKQKRGTTEAGAAVRGPGPVGQRVRVLLAGNRVLQQCHIRPLSFVLSCSGRRVGRSPGAAGIAAAWREGRRTRSQRVQSKFLRGPLMGSVCGLFGGKVLAIWFEAGRRKRSEKLKLTASPSSGL